MLIFKQIKNGRTAVIMMWAEDEYECFLGFDVYKHFPEYSNIDDAVACATKWIEVGEHGCMS